MPSDSAYNTRYDVVNPVKNSASQKTRLSKMMDSAKELMKRALLKTPVHRNIDSGHVTVYLISTLFLMSSLALLGVNQCDGSNTFKGGPARLCHKDQTAILFEAYDPVLARLGGRSILDLPISMPSGRNTAMHPGEVNRSHPISKVIGVRTINLEWS
ncbi:hypothetical protein SLS62_006380 [Diatrype stigma]|uniref:Uncharacterized protein n=1 Tax=Diatrype stigma TaxID=117547 RepID=A0AAN9UMR8_9PEZI